MRVPRRHLRLLAFLLLVGAIFVGAGIVIDAGYQKAMDRQRAATIVARVDSTVQRKSALGWSLLFEGAPPSSADAAMQVSLQKEVVAGLDAAARLGGEGFVARLRRSVEVSSRAFGALRGLSVAEVRQRARSGLTAVDEAVRVQAKAASIGLSHDGTRRAVTARRWLIITLIAAATALVAVAYVTVRAYHAAREANARRLRTLVEGSADVFLGADRNHVIQFATGATEEMLGPASRWSTGASFQNLLADSYDDFRVIANHAMSHGSTKGEFDIRRGDGKVIPVEATVRATTDVVGWDETITLHDLTDRKALDEYLRQQALHDPLTGLGNRTLFDDRLALALRGRERRGAEVGVMFLDLDGFKEINDELGHACGDRVLQETGRRLESVLRKEDTVARLGGDEFAVVLASIAASEGVARTKARVERALAAPIVIDGKTITAKASIGVKVSGPELCTAETLVSAADAAMYAQKRSTAARQPRS